MYTYKTIQLEHLKAMVDDGWHIHAVSNHYATVFKVGVDMSKVSEEFGPEQTKATTDEEPKVAPV